MRRTIMLAAAALVATVLPAAGQTVTEIKNISVMTENFPATVIAWTLAGATGSYPIGPPWWGDSFAVPAGTTVPSTANIEFRDAATGLALCQLDVEITGPINCAPKPPSSACVLLQWGSGSDLCSVRIRRN